jgi:hypothetical protein
VGERGQLETLLREFLSFG